MGLTIHYSFRAPEADASTVKDTIYQLWRSTMTAGFVEIGDILHLRGDKCNFNFRDRYDGLRWMLAFTFRGRYDGIRWLLAQAAGAVSHSPEDALHERPIVIRVRPLEVIAFTTLPGAGCEPANFGLARYPKFVSFQHGDKQHDVSTGDLGEGWHWHSFCITQYASHPYRGGIRNFLRCHLAVIKVLDTAKSLGILADVSDEGGYWENRDVEALAQEVGRWNAITAAFTGALNDAARAAGNDDIVAPILEYPEFEHLEADGHKLLEQMYLKTA